MDFKKIDLPSAWALAGTVCCWASVPVMLREIATERYLDAWTANGLRYPIAAALYWPILLMARRAGRLDPGLFRRALVPAGITFCGQILWAMAPYHLEATLIGFLIQSAILWTLTGAMILFPDERRLLRKPIFYAGVILAIIGVAALSISQGAFERESDFTGVLIILCCGVFFGLYAVSVRYFMPKDIPLFAFGVVANYVSIGTVALMLLFGNLSLVPKMNVNAWSVTVLSAVLGIAMAHVLLYTAIQRVGAAISNSASLAIPFVTLVLASLTLGEKLSPFEWLAGLVTVSGGALLFLSQTGVKTARD
jgi:drug/metabolite transporter (DMT)-like permease